MSHNSDSELLGLVDMVVNARATNCPARPVHQPDLLPPEADGQQSLPFRLTGSQAKTAYALRLNAERMINGDSPGHFATDPEGKPFWKVEKPEFLRSTGFLTLTVGDFICTYHGQQLPTDKPGEDDRHVFCPVCASRMKFVKIHDSAEANRRFNNLNRHFIGNVFSRAIAVTERHKDAGIHFHLLGRMAGGQDIRTGLNFEAVEKRDYRTAPEALRAVWALLRDTLPRYGFGRAELLPVKKTSEAVSAYISKYIEKNICNRLEEDKRKKLVRYIGWEKTQLKPNEFSWATPRAIAWRGKARELAGYIGITAKEQCTDALGPRWAMHLSSTWQGRTKDEIVPFIVADAWTKRQLTNDLAQISRSRRPGWLDNVECPALPFLESEDATAIFGQPMPDLFRVDEGLPPDRDLELERAFADGWPKYLEFEKNRLAEIAEAMREKEFLQENYLN